MDVESGAGQAEESPVQAQVADTAKAQVADKTAPGRPRDASIDANVLAAALEVYGSQGWSGFTFGKVATRAHVGKSSLYLRWSDKTDLLLDALSTAESLLADLDEGPGSGTFVERMRETIRKRISAYFTTAGLALVRLMVENQAAPHTMSAAWQGSVGQAVMSTRTILQRAKREGALVPETNVVALGDALEGAMLMHFLATPPHLRDKTLARLDEHADALLAGVVGPWLSPRAGVLPSA